MRGKVLLLFLLASLNCINIIAQKVTIDGVTYSVEGKEAYVSKFDKRLQDIVVKSEVTINGSNYRVTKFGKDKSFAVSLGVISSKMLRTVKLPSSIRIISTGAFSDCSLLTTIEMQEGVEIIKNGAFYLCTSLKKIIIPNSVKIIDDWAFQECTSLSDLTLPDTEIRIGECAFFNCKSITFVKTHSGNIPTYAINYLPKECNYIQSGRYNIPQQQIVYVQAPQQQIVQIQSPVQQPIRQEQHKLPSSDIDTNIPTNPTTNLNTFAFIFANEDYHDSSLSKVEYALNDGEMFKEYCHKVLGLPEENICFRKNATLNHMRADISLMQKIAEKKGSQARFIFYYSGHGIPDEKSGSSYLLPVDGIPTMIESGYSLQQLYKLLGKLPCQGITVFLDACFSGTNRGEGMLTSARAAAIDIEQEKPQGKMVVFSAAQGNETAFPYKEKEHGLFTYFLLKKLKETKGNVTMGELRDYIIEQVSLKSLVSNRKDQTPDISTSPALGASWKKMKLK